MPKKIIKLPDVMAITSLSRSSIYDFIKKGAFPKPVPLGSRAVGWVEREVYDWIEQRAEMREGRSGTGNPQPINISS